MESNFKLAFKILTGNDPFPWQEALYKRFAAGDFPSSCNLPTGLGKTSIIAIWLIALKNHPEKMPRRLVYVVNRRTVVDQTTTEVENLRKNLKELDPTAAPLAISTLRGQFADNREWSADPSLPAVICGTVDMIGSRLLFSGYGVGFKSKPLHAGFLGQDVLLVHDEAHLEPAFQQLIVDIEKEQHQGRFRDLHPLRVMELSATSRGQGNVFKLTPEDEANESVKKRIHANKTMAFHPVTDEKKELADKLIARALHHKNSHGAILVFVRTIDDLGKVVDGLKKQTPNVRQLTGTMRGYEREKLVTDPLFARFLPESNRPKDVAPTVGTVYLVCTSAGEVGVNISADHLVCDLSPLDSMAQRFGRVNRFGLRDHAQIDIIHPTSFKKKEEDPLAPSRQMTLELLNTLNADASPARLGTLIRQLSVEELKSAFTPEPIILKTSDILFDTWALTTIKDKLPGRPPVAEYLHGVSEWEPPQTKIAWRSEVAEIVDELLEQHHPEDLLDEYPLKAYELLADRADRVFATLKKLPASPRTPVWIVDDEGKVKVTTLATLTERDSKIIANMTVLLPPQAGGLESGFLSTARFDPELKDYDIANEWKDKNGRLRKRLWNDEENGEIEPMKLVCKIVFPNPDDEDAPPLKIWRWYVRPAAAETDAKDIKEYFLQPHLDDAKAAAEKFAAILPDAELLQAVILAATYHDLGKDRELWQHGVGNTNYPSKKWAKSGKRQATMQRSSYRHEFGSLLDVQAKAEFTTLSQDSKELVLHLIAAHHGRARPHFPIDEMMDANYSPDQTRSLASEVPKRFTRLQCKFGRWGLAYLESLVRAADIFASRKAEGHIS